MAPTRWTLPWILFIISILPPRAAHVDTVSFPTFTVLEREVRVEVRVDSEYFSEVITNSGNRADELASHITNAIGVEANGRPLGASNCKIEFTRSGQAESGRRESATTDVLFYCNFTSTAVIEYFKIRYTLLAGHDPRHRGFGTIRVGERTESFIFKVNNRFESSTRDFGSTKTLSAAFTFFVLGMDHILTGYDHLLFLFGLLIAARSLKNLAAVITGFTIGHSVTLVAAALEWFALPGSIVEPAIAASVAFIGIENLIKNNNSQKRWLVASVFGLIHGLGFAGFLEETQLPADAAVVCLASFNIGVEAGQAAIICVLFPALTWVRDRNEAKFRIYLFLPASLAVALAGIVWFVNRISN